VCGLTFGVDEGNLVEIVMNDNVEYLGRALNVASRLQGSIKDNDKKPAYKVLLSRPAFKHLRIGRDLYKIQDVGRRLRNIYGGAEMKFVKVWLPILEKKP
jgi:class 3 adenylate cyclase